MKKTASNSVARQEAPSKRMFAAMMGARASLYDAVLSAGMTVFDVVMEEERTRLCGPRYAHDDPLTPRTVEQMVLGVSTRHYDRSLEPSPAPLSTRGTSKSAVSRRFV